MTRIYQLAATGLTMALTVINGVQAQPVPQPPAGNAVRVTADNFTRAESDTYFSNIVKLAGGIGRFYHRREIEPIDRQLVIRANRDTLYSAAVFDLDPGPVTITLPDGGKRFSSMIVIGDDQYMPAVVYDAGHYTYSKVPVGVPVDGFWSISVYKAKGYFEPNKYDAYTLNNITAKKSADGSVAVQFGGCDGKIANCLPTVPGWNYLVRLYRPRAEILNGKWKFPEAQP